MFRLIITLIYIIPNIYVFFRLKRLFITSGHKKWYSIIYLLLAAIYPVVQQLSGRFEGRIMEFLSMVSGHILPFFLYMFLSLLLYELFLLVNWLPKLVSREKRDSLAFRKNVFFAMILFSIVVVGGGIINMNTMSVSKYQIEVPCRQSAIKNLRIVFVADIHIDETMRVKYIEKFVRKVDELNPDIVLFGGDIIEGRMNNTFTVDMETALRKINTKYGSYGVLGNHEFYGGQEKYNFFENSGITLLNDSIIKINDFFYLAGRLDEHVRQRKTLPKLFENFTSDLPLIQLDHRPTQLQEVSQTNVDVQFSGHTHNGQLFPFNFITRAMYELSWGYKKINKTHFFVTSGLRLWGPPVKTAGKSEIMFVDVQFK